MLSNEKRVPVAYFALGTGASLAEILPHRFRMSLTRSRAGTGSYLHSVQFRT
jgi:hypothetical protein